MKKLIVKLICSMIFLVALNSNVFAFSDVNDNDEFSKDVNTMSKYGFIKGFNDDTFRPYDDITREQFVSLMINVLGYSDLINTSGYTVNFLDVTPTRWSFGAINVAFNKGIIKGMPNGNFEPEQNINFAQICSIVINSLGYQESDLVGVWPYNYIGKAKILKLIDDINIDPKSSVNRANVAKILNRMLETSIKSNEQTAFAKSINLYSEVSVVLDSSISTKVSKNFILSDSKQYELDKDINLEVGSKYKVKVEDDKIVKYYEKINSTKQIEIDSFENNEISYYNEGKLEKHSINNSIIFYQDGVKINFDSLKNYLLKNKKVIFSINENGIDEFAIIVDTYNGNTMDELLVIGDSSTNKKIMTGEVLTDKGIFYKTKSTENLKIGDKYEVMLSDKNIVSAKSLNRVLNNIIVEKNVGNEVHYKNGNIDKSIVLPENTKYFYNGIEQKYDNVNSLIKRNTCLTFSSKLDTSGYEYCLIFDPVFSKSIVLNHVPIEGEKISGIQFINNIQILSDDKVLKVSDLKEYDVVCSVSDIFSNNSYILHKREKKNGVITAIAPNKAYPISISLDAEKYDLSEDMNYSKINTSNGAFVLNNYVTAILDKDNKIIDLIDINDKYAMVLNYSETKSTKDFNYGTKIYSVKVILASGELKTYETLEDPSRYKGTLIKFSFDNDQYIKIEEPKYNKIGDCIINKDEMMLDSDYLSNNVRIFNIISNNNNSDAIINIVDLNKFNNGKMNTSKIKFINKEGPFNDINIIVLNDYFDEMTKLLYVKENIAASGSSYNVKYSYELLLGNTSYTIKVNSTDLFKAGDVIKTKVDGTTVNSNVTKIEKIESGSKLQAIDNFKIMLNDKIYKFNEKYNIYYKNNSGGIVSITYDKVDLTKNYTDIKLYSNKPLNEGGKIEVVVITE